jgi:hypothetical protein
MAYALTTQQICGANCITKGKQPPTAMAITPLHPAADHPAMAINNRCSPQIQLLEELLLQLAKGKAT